MERDTALGSMIRRRIASHPDAPAVRFKVGTRLMLNATPDSEVELRCGERAMFTGRMGRRGNHVSICVDRGVKKQD